MDIYHPEKLIWSDRDFEGMGWHDATVWSMVADAENFEFMVDIDYIFDWVHPEAGETYFKFWVAPVTMVFENASDVYINLKSQQGCVAVVELRREVIGPSPNSKYTQYRYVFECQEGEIQLEATSFSMYVRRSPALLTAQSFELTSRKGVSFSRVYSDA